MYKYYLIYKTNELRIKSFKEYDDMFGFLLRLKVENKYNDKFKYKVVYGHELSYINDFVDDLFKLSFDENFEDILEYIKGN